MGGHPYGRGASCPGRSPWTSRTGRCAGTTGPEFKPKTNILRWDFSEKQETDQLDRLKSYNSFCFISENSWGSGGGIIWPVHCHLFRENPTQKEERRRNCDRADTRESEAEVANVGHCCYYHLGDAVGFVYMIYADVSSDERPPGGLAAAY